MFEKRLCSRQEEHAVRLCHHDFESLPKKEAASKMNISVSRLNQILYSARKKIPTLFPILTPKQYKVLQLLNLGTARFDAANLLNLTIKQIDGVISGLHKLGVPIYHRPRIVRYDLSMDGKVVKKF